MNSFIFTTIQVALFITFFSYLKKTGVTLYDPDFWYISGSLVLLSVLSYFQGYYEGRDSP